jgi:CRP/FNR family transcriptional regulator
VSRALQDQWHRSWPLEFERGDYLFLPGDPARSVFLLHSGWVRIGRLLDSGGELTLDVAGPGELVGEDALYGESPRVRLAQALSPVAAAPAPVAGVAEALGRSPELAAALNRLLWERSRRLEARAVESAFADCRRRLCRTLLDLADRFGVDEPEGRRIAIRLTHEELSRLIGAARETVTPLLVALRREGAIDYDRRRLLVRERRMLEA